MVSKKEEVGVESVPVEFRDGMYVARKIQQLREKVKTIKATKMNAGGMHYNYLSENELTNSLRPVMNELGLVLVPVNVCEQTVCHDLTVNGKDRKVLLTTATVGYKLFDSETGDCIYVESVGSGADSMDKGANKANTCAFKNILRMIGMFPSPEREDTDGTPNTGGSRSYSSDPGTIQIKYGDYKGSTIKELFDKDPVIVEKLAEGSNWLAGKAKEFLQSVA